MGANGQVTDAALTSITRRVGGRPVAHRRPPRSEMNDNPHYWLGTLAASIHGHLNDRQPRERLEHDYREFLDSPCCTDSLRVILDA